MSTAPSSSTQAQPADQRARNFEWPLSLSAWNAVDDTWAPPSQQPKEYKQENRATATCPPRKFVWPLSLRVWNTVDDCWAVDQSPSESSSDLGLASGELSEHLSIITVDRLRVYVDYVLRITGFVIAWAYKIAKGVVRRVLGLNPEYVVETDEEVNPDGTLKTNAKFVSKVNKAIQNTPLAMFFSPNSKFIEELAGKAAALADDPGTRICGEKLLPKTVQVTMHQQVLLFDYSTPMDSETHMDSLELSKRIAQVTTRILPEGEHVYVRYVKQMPNRYHLNSEGLADITPISTARAKNLGENLTREVLEPLVYKMLPNNLQRPLLISIITDWMPEWERNSRLVHAITECRGRLEAAGLPHQCVKFLFVQVGSATMTWRQRSARWLTLKPLRYTRRFLAENVAFFGSENLDDAFSKLSDGDIDKWLIESLYAPIMKGESKKDR